MWRCLRRVRWRAPIHTKFSHQRHRRNAAQRPVRLDQDFETWEESFRFVWEDLADAEAQLKVFVVAPMPPVTMFQGTVGTVIFMQHPLPEHFACVLTSVLGDLPDARTSETAHSFEMDTEYEVILRSSDMAELCRLGPTSAYDLCDLKIGSRVLPPGQAVRVSNGLGLLLILLNEDDDIPIEVVEEDQSLMQVSSSSSEAPARYMSRILQFDSTFFDGTLSWETSERFWRALGTIIQLPTSHIRAVYPVRDPPADLRRCFQKVFIVHSYRDSRPADQMRVALIDVEHAAADAPERSVKWIPYKVTGNSLLKLLHLEGLCWWVTDECTVWQNGYLVLAEQPDPLDMFLMATI